MDKRSTKNGAYGSITPERIKEIKTWKQEGVSDKEIAKRLGVTTPTLYNWRKKHAEFGAIWDWTKQVDEEIAGVTPDIAKIVKSVEDALLKRCLGMTITETSISPDGKKWVKTKELPPDPNACYQWLKVHSAKWKQAVQITVTGSSEEVEDNPLLGMKRGDLEKLVKMAGESV